MDKIISEIYEEFKKRGLTEQELADRTGIPQATLHRLITGANKKLDMEKVKVVQRALGLRPWIEPHHIVPRSEPETGSVYMNLPIYCGDCGPGRVNEPPENWMTFTTTFAKTTFGANGNSLACLRAAGDSMQPAINPGDLVVINITDSSLSHDGAIYALQMGETTSIKRLYRLPGGLVRISSDNPTGWTKEVNSEEIEAEGIRIAGRVVFIGKLT